MAPYEKLYRQTIAPHYVCMTMKVSATKYDLANNKKVRLSSKGWLLLNNIKSTMWKDKEVIRVFY